MNWGSPISSSEIWTTSPLPLKIGWVVWRWANLTPSLGSKNPDRNIRIKRSSRNGLVYWPLTFYSSHFLAWTSLSISILTAWLPASSAINSSLLFKCPPRIQYVVCFEKFILFTIFGHRTNLSDSDGPCGKIFVRHRVAEQIVNIMRVVEGCSFSLRCLMFISSKVSSRKGFWAQPTAK